MRTLFSFNSRRSSRIHFYTYFSCPSPRKLMYLDMLCAPLNSTPNIFDNLLQGPDSKDILIILAKTFKRGYVIPILILGNSFNIQSLKFRFEVSGVAKYLYLFGEQVLSLTKIARMKLDTPFLPTSNNSPQISSSSSVLLLSVSPRNFHK